jgi:hypothetical protein
VGCRMTKETDALQMCGEKGSVYNRVHFRCIDFKIDFSVPI